MEETVMTQADTCPRCHGDPSGIGCLRCDNLGVLAPGAGDYAALPLTGATPDARHYSGDLPDGIDSVDELVAELAASVERVRAKFGATFDRLIAEVGGDYDDLMAEVNRDADFRIAARRAASRG
jgi:hypothetical protein